LIEIKCIFIFKQETTILLAAVGFSFGKTSLATPKGATPVKPAPILLFLAFMALV
jgi:hypothetical protein